MTLNKVFAVKVDNQIGKFHQVAGILSENDINILYTYAFRDETDGVFVFKVDQSDFDKAVSVLQKNKLEIVDSSCFY